MKKNYITSPEMLGEFIKSHRKTRGMTQNELSKIVGMRQESISNLENQTKRIRIDNLFRILSALNLDMILTDKNVVKQAGW